MNRQRGLTFSLVMNKTLEKALEGAVITLRTQNLALLFEQMGIMRVLHNQNPSPPQCTWKEARSDSHPFAPFPSYQLPLNKWLLSTKVLGFSRLACWKKEKAA